MRTPLNIMVGTMPSKTNDLPLDKVITTSNFQNGPALLVPVLVFAQDRLLLLKRGLEPYKGKWAPPGGFVEHGESLETAAVREVWEEMRIKLDPKQLMPHGVVSIPRINQVYHAFNVCLSDMVAASAVLPESLEVGWFSESDLSTVELWEPAANVDIGALFEGIRAGRFDFFQRSDEFSRVISERRTITYLSRRD